MILTDELRAIIEAELPANWEAREPDMYELVYVSYDEQIPENVGFFQHFEKARTRGTYEAMNLDSGRHNPDAVPWYDTLKDGWVVYSMCYTRRGAYAIYPWFMEDSE